MHTRLVAAGLVVLTALVVTISAAGAAQETRIVASATTSDFRVVVTAAKRGSGDAPTAAVALTTSKRVGSAWKRTAEHRLAGPYFWHTVTGPLAVCRLEIRTTAARTGFRPHVTVQLLQSPSLGCGPISRFDLKR